MHGVDQRTVIVLTGPIHLKILYIQNVELRLVPDKSKFQRRREDSTKSIGSDHNVYYF